MWTVFGSVGFMAATCMFAFWVPPVKVPGTVVGLVLYGMISGSWFALLPAATASISPVRETGMRFGLVVTSLAVPSLVGPVITSALIINDSYRWAGVWIGLCCFVSGVLVNTPPAWIKWKRRRELASGRGPRENSNTSAAFDGPQQLGTVQEEK